MATVILALVLAYWLTGIVLALRCVERLGGRPRLTTTEVCALFALSMCWLPQGIRYIRYQRMARGRGGDRP